jgi:hypothetical protein
MMMPRTTKILLLLPALALLAVGLAWQRPAFGQSPDEPPWPSEAFRAQWQRTDGLVAQGAADYSWYWGPGPRSGPLLERNDDAAGGRLLVQYFDKGRMEQELIYASAKAARQLSFGRLVAELVSGNVQLGSQRFDSGRPAAIPVAGDMDDPLAPTYASFARVASATGSTAVPRASGQVPNLSIDREGQVIRRDDLAQSYPETAYSDYDAGLGHNIPAVFSRFMARAGLVETTEGRRREQIVDAVAVFGRPISEAYWVEVELGNAVRPALVQLYERRVLTYTPSNPAAYRVEMGNVGLHYYVWRYLGAGARTPRREQLLAHFENGDQALNGNYWFSFDDRNDGGTSFASNALIGPGIFDSVRAMRFEYNVTDALPFSFAALAVSLGPGGNPVDIRSYSAVGFWARGNNTRHNLLISSALADEPFAASFVAPPNWTWIEIPLASLQQAADRRTLDQGSAFSTATRLQFRPASRPSSGFLDVDNLVLVAGDVQPTQNPGLPTVDDFEDGNLTSALNTDWFTYSDLPDGGSSTIGLELVAPGDRNSRGALRVRGTLLNKNGPAFAGFGIPLAQNGGTVDLTDVQAIQISVRTDGNHYRLLLASPLIQDGNQYGITLDAPANEWAQLYIPISLLDKSDGQRDQPISKELALTQIENIIIAPLDAPRAFQLVIDDVRLVR